MYRYMLMWGFLLFSVPLKAQLEDSVNVKWQQVREDVYTKMEKKYSSIDRKLTKKSNKYLKRLQRRENKLFKKLSDFDTAFAKTLKVPSDNYNEFASGLTAKKAALKKVNLDEYNSWIDTLETSLSFLEQYDGLSEKIKLPSDALNTLKAKFNETGRVQALIAERRQYLKEALGKYTNLPRSLQKQYKEFNKTAFYYSQQANEYKELLGNRRKAEEKAIALLRDNKDFQDFMQQNSQLAALFRLPGNAGGVQNLSGLQTRASVQSMLQERIASGGANAMAQVKQNISAAYAEMDKLKDKLNEVANGSGDPDMPVFKPNTQKTKPFLKRLEYGCDVDFGRNNPLLPAAAKLAGSVAYKFHQHAVAGIGLGYHLGLGSIEHIRFSHEGVSMRSFIDWKAPVGNSKRSLLKNIWVSGGYEMNYNAGFKHIEQLRDFSAWQRSALLGIGKKYRISKKVKGEMKLLYDFLHREHVPVSRAFVWRLGYKF